jgi:predicted GTPase
MSLLQKFLEKIKGDDVPPPLRMLGITPEQLRRLRTEAQIEAEKAPRIALIGETGVGKSSTINALFNAGRETSHTHACTTTDGEFHYRGSKGDVTVVDMPGVGEGIDEDELHLKTYRRVIPGCDVTLWVLKADSRAVSHVQRVLDLLVHESVLDPKRLVIGLNQIDLLQPGAWDTRINQPSEEQDATILARTADVQKKLRRVCDLPADRVVPYSALKNYALDRLLQAMLAACERRRQWVLFERAACADFTSLVDPEVLREVERS